jgi:hypothetical protein
MEESDMLVMDGYDDCIIGTIERCGQPIIYCYDKVKVIDHLKSNGMTEDEAVEFFYFNQVGSWMGDTTPCFLSKT